MYQVKKSKGVAKENAGHKTILEKVVASSPETVAI